MLRARKVAGEESVTAILFDRSLKEGDRRAQDESRWRPLVNVTMNLRVPQEREDYVSRRGTHPEEVPCSAN